MHAASSDNRDWFVVVQEAFRNKNKLDRTHVHWAYVELETMTALVPGALLCQHSGEKVKLCIRMFSTRGGQGSLNEPPCLHVVGATFPFA